MTHSGLPAFVCHVHFIEDRLTALERAVDAVQFATGAAWVAAYTLDPEGVYTLGSAAGDMPFGDLDAVDQDDEAMVALRAERDALDAPAGSVLAGALLLPFVAAGRLRGLMALGAVPYAYTGAERESLQAVATAVGLAMEVLQRGAAGGGLTSTQSTLSSFPVFCALTENSAMHLTGFLAMYGREGMPQEPRNCSSTRSMPHTKLFIAYTGPPPMRAFTCRRFTPMGAHALQYTH